MKLKIIDDGIKNDLTPVDVEMWFDRHQRLWVIYLISKDKYQVSDAQYAVNKQEALEIKQELLHLIK